ncbi:MAG TPA: 3-hydroxyacyl-CoA dehydrogenase NAD-binding domain-containing protein [Planctomycetaceae bacterium]|nr:3-hydroxyacyl-CoA dehydrogenase NAD-binding domain-containing protein [Planctomycetaceae bacterium]HQZ64404.1 3-hydroxyacyl-CoA dehydrogenase NAD-binding domain-containing protein [Planctomycetaceae bacterium]
MKTKEDRIQTVSIIGAGVMGHGIAELSVRAGMRVRICDSNAAAAEAAVEAIKNPRRGELLIPQFLDVSDAADISAATCDAEIADADLIIETVSENLALKTAILSRIEPFLPSRTIVASNSSSFPISQLASSLKNPARFCGLHFCHPVSERPLVEVVGGKSTSRQTLERAFAFATSLGKAPIVVQDSPGFLLNRLLVPYLNEAMELLLEGADVAALDRTAKMFGMPQGPLALFDEFGIDVALSVGRSLFWTFPDRIVPSELLIAMYKSGLRGRKSGGGFYLTPEAADTGQLAPRVMELIAARQRANYSFSDEQIQRRLLLPMLLEATRALQESLVVSSTTIDTALRDGLGMTSLYRGLFGWADSIGAATIIDWLRPLEALGKRFESTELLQDAARNNHHIGEQGTRAA